MKTLGRYLLLLREAYVFTIQGHAPKLWRPPSIQTIKKTTLGHVESILRYFHVIQRSTHIGYDFTRR